MKFGFGNVELFSPDFYYDFMKHRKLWVAISGVLVVLSFIFLASKGLNYSIDFLGGSEINISTSDSQVNRDSLLGAVREVVPTGAEVTSISSLSKENSQGFVIRIQRAVGQNENETSNQVDLLLTSLKNKFGADKITVGAVVNISGKIGKEEELKGYFALLLACLGILFYVSIRFDSRFAPGAVLCLVHDIVIAVGFMTIAGKPFSTSSIAAFLTIVGYSINDTVIVYDRIRENQVLLPRAGIVEIVNKSLSQTMNRTVLTSATGLGALLVLTFFGGGSIEDFALTMFVGILVGTYSSIYVAAPLTIMMDETLRKYGILKDKDPNVQKAVRDPNYIPPVIVRKR